MSKEDGLLRRAALMQDRSLAGAVLIGLAAAGLGLVLRAVLQATLADYFEGIGGFTLYLPLVLIATLMAGGRAGTVGLLASLVLGLMVAWFSSGTGQPLPSSAYTGAGLFIAVGAFCVFLAASLRRTIQGLEESRLAISEVSARAGETESRFQLLSEDAPVMLWMSDETGACVHLNRAQRMFWGAPDDLGGFDWKRTVSPEDLIRMQPVFVKAMADRQPFTVEGRYRRADGQERILYTEASPRFDGAGRFVGMIGVNTDVTDARAAESAIRESEIRFRLMADTAPAPVWLTNADAEVEFVNEALLEFYGESPDSILGHAWKLAMHPDDAPAVADIQAQFRPQRMPYGFEARFRNAAGRWRWMRVTVKPRFADDGAFMGYIGMSFDISDAREALDRLERQERRQSFLLDLADRLRDLEDSDAIMAEVEQSLGRELGVQRVGYGEVDPERGTVSMSKDWTADVSSFRGEWSVEAFGLGLITDLQQGRMIRIGDVRRDRRTRDAADAFEGIQTRSLMRVPLMRFGKLRAFLYVHDSKVRRWTDAEADLIEEVAERTWAEIERARALTEVRESEERFRAIADTAPVLIWVTQQDRTRAFVNQAYVAYDGRSYEEARLADWRTIIHPDDHERIIRESVAGEGTGQPFSMEARYLRHDGEYRWLRSFSRPRFGAGGEVIGFVGVAFDVTDAKRAETDLKRINELLEERVGDALAEKAKAEADLMHAQRMEAIGRLTGGVAHDFNNLLTVVIGALDIILRSPDDAAKRTKLGEAALSAARRGERLTHQLLAFSRRQSLRPEIVDLNGLIREGEPLLRKAAGEGTAFALKLARGGVHANVDPAQFEAALLNLVVNAGDAVGHAGEVRVETRLIDLETEQVRGVSAGRYVQIQVRDTGEGMSTEVIARAFEPFFTTKPVGKGTGLGLSQVYGFSQQSGGGVSVESRVGKGTTLSLYLPCVEPRASHVPDAQSLPTKEAVERRRMLLVEDDAAVAAIAVDLLTEMGMDVTYAQDGASAIERLEKSTFDIVLTDIVMPGMSGLDLAGVIETRWPDTRVLLTSGYAGDDADLGSALPKWPLLRKPYTAEDLRGLIIGAQTSRE